jgi:transglutaminase-like putative cysteine protease
MRGLQIPSSLRLNIPDGAAGTRETLKHMRQLAQQGRADLSSRDLANAITASVRGKNWRGEIAAIFNWVRGNIRYALDPNELETIQGAATTVALGYGDCDDFAILLATLCECAGHPSCFVALGFAAPGDFSHVVAVASGAGETPWVWMDATEAHPLGWYPPGATCAMICPVSKTAEETLGRFGLQPQGPGGMHNPAMELRRWS